MWLFCRNSDNSSCCEFAMDLLFCVINFELKFIMEFGMANKVCVSFLAISVAILVCLGCNVTKDNKAIGASADITDPNLLPGHFHDPNAILDPNHVHDPNQKYDHDHLEDDTSGDDKPFAEVIKDFQCIEGLFNFYRDTEKEMVYFAIKPEQFEQVYLCSLTRQRGEGKYFHSASQEGEFPFYFKRVGKRVFMMRKNLKYRAHNNEPAQRAIHDSLSDSAIAWATIESAPHEINGGVLLSAAVFFVRDAIDVNQVFASSKNKYSFDGKGSYFGDIQAFPENVEVQVVLNFKGKSNQSSMTITDAGTFQHTYQYSLSSLPENDYQPRNEDLRVGHFVTMHQDYGDLTMADPYVRYINRWHLAKADPNSDLSKPIKPIVFWLANNIPLKYRNAVRRGALSWNKSFEKIGFSDAIVVKQQPDDATWSSGDVRYSTISWMIFPGRAFAVGPSRADPYTGQIYDADIRISADYIRFIYKMADDFSKPLTPPLPNKHDMHTCEYGYEAAIQASFGYHLIAARTGGLGHIDMQNYIDDFLANLVAHEVGHTLGLRHNFKASAYIDNKALHSDAVTSSGILSSSVMDYVPLNLAPKGTKQGKYFQTAVGPYDDWAIAYAYSEANRNGGVSEKEMLSSIMQHAGEPALAYGTDEDAMDGAMGLDPICIRYDLGRDPIAWFKTNIDLANELVASMEATFEVTGEKYQRYRAVFRQVMRQYTIASMNIPKYIGGMHIYRHHIGDKGGHLPLEPVPAQRQFAALHFITEYLFGKSAFDYPASLMRKLIPSRGLDFEWAIFSTRIDYPLHKKVLEIQKRALSQMFATGVLARIEDLSMYYEAKEVPFTMVDLFTKVRQAIWSDINDEKIVSFRRNLQRLHLKMMVQMILQQSKNEFPEDARALARLTLHTLQQDIEIALNGSGHIDAFKQAHLMEVAAQIKSALNASATTNAGK